MKLARANHIVRQVMLMILPIFVFTTVQIIDTKTTIINFALKNNFVEKRIHNLPMTSQCPAKSIAPMICSEIQSPIHA
jgi:hypothetical protein